jgi:hypothetical protein
VVIYTASTSISTGIIRLLVDTNAQLLSIRTRFSNFSSDIGVIFGDNLMTDKTYEGIDRVIGTVPASSERGAVDVSTFNHLGQTGILVDGYTYQHAYRNSLSSNEGLYGNVLNDRNFII